MSTLHHKRVQDSAQVDISLATQFTYVLREDTRYVAAQSAERLAQRKNLPFEHSQSIIAGAYEIFCADVVQAISSAFAAVGQSDIEIHVYNAEDLERAVFEKIGAQPALSADPLLEGKLPTLGLSRHYALGGQRCIAIDQRPGYAALPNQIAELAQLFAGNAQVTLVEDDIFSGESIRAVSAMLADASICVREVVPAIQVGDVSNMDPALRINPAVHYRLPETGDLAQVLSSRIDLGDFRDFLFGACGLVERIPGGGIGRAPYVLPFVSPHRRASIPFESEHSFSKAILKANLEFVDYIERRLDIDLTLADLEPAFANLMHKVYGLEGATAARSALTWALDYMAPIWAETQEIGKVQARIAKLALPEKFVLLDVNGTLIPDEADRIDFDPLHLEALHAQIRRLQAEGIQVGLCSDSPLGPLQDLARLLCCRGPIVAENGNLLSHNADSTVVREVRDLNTLRQEISDLIPNDFVKKDDCFSPEFGGALPNFDRAEWAFGRGRSTSISLFAPAEMVEYLGREFRVPAGMSADCSPQYNYFAVHAGSDFKTNKGETLALLRQLGHRIVLVGNSASDWVAPADGLACAFVGNAHLHEHMRATAAYISPLSHACGVVDILRNIS